MYNIIIVRFGEIAVKGKNRPVFEKKLVENLKNALKVVGSPKVYRGDGRIYIDIENLDMNEIIKEATKVFGVFSVSPAIKMDKDFEILKENTSNLLKSKIELNSAKSFKVESKRTDKRFHLKSPEISKQIGTHLYLKFENSIKVDVNNPEVIIFTEIRESGFYCFSDKIMGFGGMPMGTNGKALCLLSGGIDSPVASWIIAKRGIQINAVHFHSYPFTNERSFEKVKDLAKIISSYCGEIKLFSVNLLDIQKEIAQNCPEEEMTILGRRFMMKIAQKIAVENGFDVLVTGESLGQVASQTIQGLTCTDNAVELPVFRPLIALDKTEIIEIAQKIGTFETSIIQEEDCCTVFLPKRPVTKPKLEKILESESVLDSSNLINSAIEKMDIYSIKN